MSGSRRIKAHATGCDLTPARPGLKAAHFQQLAHYERPDSCGDDASEIIRINRTKLEQGANHGHGHDYGGQPNRQRKYQARARKLLRAVARTERAAAGFVPIEDLGRKKLS